MKFKKTMGSNSTIYFQAEEDNIPTFFPPTSILCLPSLSSPFPPTLSSPSPLFSSSPYPHSLPSLSSPPPHTPILCFPSLLLPPHPPFPPLSFLVVSPLFKIIARSQLSINQEQRPHQKLNHIKNSFVNFPASTTIGK